MGGQSMPRGKREQADQIILKLREAELELSRGKTVPEAAKKIGVTGADLPPRMAPGFKLGVGLPIDQPCAVAEA